MIGWANGEEKKKSRTDEIGKMEKKASIVIKRGRCEMAERKGKKREKFVDGIETKERERKKNQIHYRRIHPLPLPIDEEKEF